MTPANDEDVKRILIKHGGLPRVLRFLNGLKSGRGFYSTLVDGESVWILGIKKKIFLFRDLFYCDLLLGSPTFVDKYDPGIKINRLRRIIICE